MLDSCVANKWSESVPIVDSSPHRAPFQEYAMASTRQEAVTVLLLSLVAVVPLPKIPLIG